MCLAIPARIVTISGDQARVDVDGMRLTISLSLLDEDVAPGDYVVVHVGYALARIDPAAAAQTLAALDGPAAAEALPPLPVVGGERAG